ncbi:MAG: hypothetical protein QOK19_124 [Solirubrobacteraceae bacterium]|nr:hypothetical protein [Solirubrobacterales bacterium]MEA2214563.1 hypothetical protein [Solirubrobacteraceae bacterium]
MSAAAAGAEGDAESGDGQRDGVDPLGSAVFAVLVLACLLAFFLTQRLKHAPTVVPSFQLTSNFSPTPAGRHKQEQISFKLSHAERATVAVIDSHGNVVATLLRGYPVPRYKQLSLRWNGRRGTARGYVTRTTPAGHRYLVPGNGGRLAPAGEYRVRLKLSGQANPVLSPKSFTLVRR